ncbi:MAG: hypothetical protein U0176_21400 [Bacteroidia bacterium]
MKKTGYFLLTISAILFIAACSTGPKKILPKPDGGWYAEKITMRSYVGNTLDSTWVISHKSTYNFVKDLTGTRVDSAGSSHSFTWFVNDNNDNFQLCYNTSGSQDCKLYLIVNSDKNAQKFTYTEAGSVNGSWTEEDLEMTRVD